MENNFNKSIFIIDGSSFLYRAYYSIKPLHSPEGKPVQAVYGFCRMIKKLISTYKPYNLVVAWDSPGKTIRHEIYDLYKYNRQAAPSDLSYQKELIQNFCDIIGITQFNEPKIEADDLMYSLAKELTEKQITSVFVTSDKDMGQALNEYIMQLDPFKNEIMTDKSLEAKYGFEIKKLPFYYSLIGDSSDNIPGARGIGPKNAQKIVQEFKSIEDLLDNLSNNLNNNLTKRAKKLILESENNIKLSYELFLLRYYKTPITKKLPKFNMKDLDKAEKLFLKLGFKSFIKNKNLKEELKETTYVGANKDYNFILVDTKDKLNTVINEIKEHNKFALDTESDCIEALESEPVGISISTHVGKSYYIPFGHKVEQIQLSKEYIIEKLKPILEDKSIEKYLHHAKYDILTLTTIGINLKNVTFDTMIAANQLTSDTQRIGLKSLSESHLSESMLSFSDVIKKNKCSDFSYVELNLAAEYAAADAHQTLKLVDKFKKGLIKENLNDLYFNIEMPLMNVLTDMEKTGILLDRSILDKANKQVSKELKNVHQEIIDIIGQEYIDINLNSSQQLSRLLFEDLKLPTVKKTAQKTGYSTNHEVLVILSKVHIVPALIIKYRELSKIKNTFIEGLINSINTKTGKIHTSFSQTRVATGRLSSSNPNLQNIPVGKSFDIRSAFIASKDHLFISADYSQIELRVLAHLSQDKNLLKAFKDGIDIHNLTASALFNIDQTEITHQQRQTAKRINFSIIYGLTAHSLSKELEVSHKQAKEYIDKFMQQYPGIKIWMDKEIEKTKDKGYVETFWGRRRYLPGIYEKNKNIFELTRRSTINTIVQGTAAELVKLSMIKLHELLKSYKSNILLQIHDELIIEVEKQDKDIVKDLVEKTLEGIVNWDTPLKVVTRIGKNWQEVTK